MRDIRLTRFDHAAVQSAITQLTKRMDELRSGSTGSTQVVSGGSRLLVTRGQTVVEEMPCEIPTEFTIDQIIGLVDALNNKAQVLHFHSIEQIEGLTEQLETLANAMASHTLYGSVRLSVDPANPEDPIAVGNNDPRLQNLSGSSHTHTQSLASVVWTVQHDLGFVPSIEVVDPAGTLMWPGVEHNHVSNPTITLLHFLAPTSGLARFS